MMRIEIKKTLARISDVVKPIPTNTRLYRIHGEAYPDPMAFNPTGAVGRATPILLQPSKKTVPYLYVGVGNAEGLLSETVYHAVKTRLAKPTSSIKEPFPAEGLNGWLLSEMVLKAPIYLARVSSLISINALHQPTFGAADANYVETAAVAEKLMAIATSAEGVSWASSRGELSVACLYEPRLNKPWVELVEPRMTKPLLDFYDFETVADVFASFNVELEPPTK